MELLKLTWKNMWHRKALVILAMSTVAIATAFIVFVQLLNDKIEQTAKEGYGPYELVVGKAGSDMQLMLHTFYHIGEPVGNIDYAVYEYVEKSPWQQAAFAMTRGDSYEGYPLIGVDPNYLSNRYPEAKVKGAVYSQVGEVVVGAHVAKSLQLQIGDTFFASHGEVHSSHEQHEDIFEVVGILSPLGTPDDQAIFTTLNYAWLLHDGEGMDRERGPITSIVIQPKGLMELQQLADQLNEFDDVQAIYSGKIVSSILSFVDTSRTFVYLISMVAFIIALMAVMLVLLAVSLQRQKDIALLRLIGKSQNYIVSTIVLEGMWITLLGSIFGLILGHIVTGIFSPIMYEKFSVQLDAFQFVSGEGWIVLICVVIGLFASIWPAIRAYRTDPLTLFHQG